MKWAATIANFFLPGLGNIITGYKRLLGVGWLIAVIGLTYVEFGIKESEPTLYTVMFASVLVLNLMFAIDIYRSFETTEAAHT